MDSVLARTLLRERAVRIAENKLNKKYLSHQKYNLDSLINTLINGDENGEKCAYCYHFFPEETMIKTRYGNMCYRCFLKNMPDLNTCCRCKTLTTDSSPAARLVIPVIRGRSGAKESFESSLLFHTFEDNLYPCLEMPGGTQFYIARSVLPDLKNFLLEHEKRNEACPPEDYEKVILFLEKCYEDYGQFVCPNCLEYYGHDWRSCLVTQNYSFELAWYTLNLLDGEKHKRFIDFVSHENIAYVEEHIVKEEEAKRELHALDRKNLLKLKYHPEILSEFTDRDFASIKSKKGFHTNMTNIKRMVSSALKYSIEQFKDILLVDLGIDSKGAREKSVFELNVNQDKVEALIIILADGEISISQKQASELFEAIVIRREFYNYLSDNNFLTSRGVIYTPYIDSYEMFFDDCDQENIIVIINMNLDYTKEKTSSTI